MTLQTNLNQPPYMDDYDESKDYYKILFQPGVSVQVRELNQLQTMFQKQVERFGDNIFKQGTIVSGCNFAFNPAYPYVKILDNEVDGTIAVPANYKGNFAVCTSSGLSAQILDYEDGFESSDPDLKTLYLRYQNSGNDGNTVQFTAGDTLTIQSLTQGISKVAIVNGGSGFSNSDTVVALSQLIVNVASGSFANGDYVMNNLGANVQIIGIDTTTYATQNQIILNVAPRTTDLVSATATASAWTLNSGDAVTNQSNSVSARIEGIIGAGFRGKVVTDSVGKATTIMVLSQGQKYTIPPYITIQSANNSTGIGLLSLTPHNYVGRVKVASVAAAVGNGYSFSVSQGVIYQKGYFLRVDPQTIIVDKYDTAPDQVAVGFYTREQIVNYNLDQTLLDNANGTLNFSAPGADRMQLVPSLVITTKSAADANVDFFTIVAWSEGNPYLQQQSTAYNKIEDQMAKQISEQSGDFVVDSFLMSTRSPLNANLEGNTYSVVIDPGTAYIDGYRVQTLTNYVINVPKPTNTNITNAHSINLNYGNYIYCNNVGGVFQFNTGDTVNLYDAPKGYLSNTTLIAAGNTSPVGNLIGTAHIRSMVLDEGTPGGADAIYRLYLFDINMNAGASFRNVQSVYYNGTSNKGVADVVLSVDGTTNTSVAVLQEANSSQLLFSTGVDSLKNANNISYTYRTIDQTVTVANNGILTKSIATSPNETYPYTGALTAAQMTDELYVVPTGIDLVAASNIAGSVSVSNTSTNATGTGTAFFTDLRVGDFVYVQANTTTYQLKRVSNIVNNTLIQFQTNCSFTSANAAVYRAFPVGVPVPFGYRSGLTANVDTNQTTLTLNFGMSFNQTTSANVAVGVNIFRSNITQLTKTPNRSQFVKIDIANNAGGTLGPWCLGVPDIFRLRGVWVGNSSVDNTGPNSITNFYVDHNQNPDFLDLGWLYLAPKASVSLTSGNYILVEFDYYSTSGVGFCDPISYVSSNTAQRVLVDSQPLANLTSSVNSFEVPEIFDNQGNEYDLLQYFDFRPIASLTVTPSTTAGAAPVNPSNTVSFGNTSSTANEKKFPLPGSVFTCVLEQYLGRTDSVFVASDGSITVATGKEDSDITKQYAPATPSNAIKLTDLIVPAFPNLPIVRSTNLQQILTTYVMNGRYLKSRTDNRAITKPRTTAGTVFDVPQVYTMADIGQIDRRLQDVEYYVSLNMLQSNVQSMAIPSSVDPSLNRFKYGFFADDLSTYAYTDRENPTYAAYIENNAAVPEKLTWDSYLDGALGGPDYIDFMIVNQENATWPDTLGPVCILQYVTYNVEIINGQYYLNTGTPGAAPTPINPAGLIGGPQEVSGGGSGMV